ncbi:MAG: DUF6174 domain-containing protein [Candidatus Limnocylindria bacterium]
MGGLSYPRTGSRPVDAQTQQADAVAVGAPVLLVIGVTLSSCSTPSVDLPSAAPQAFSSTGANSLAPASPSAAPAWKAPPAYAFTVESRCGERNLIGRWRAEVEDGDVVQIEGLDQQSRRVTLSPGELPTLAEMLSRASEVMARPGTKVTVATDPWDGHPTYVEIDWNVSAIDDEECYRISEFVVSGG